MDEIRKFEPFFAEWYAESLIGSGSFGRVYKICREELGDRLYSAMKYIPIPQDHEETDTMKDEGMSEKDISTYYGKIAYQLRDEIRLMNELKGNTNIVSYEDSRIIPKADGMGFDIFIRMELLTSLRAYTKQRPLDKAEIVKLGTDICSALTLCEKKGILHRDIKPDNIFVNDNGDFKLGDFGIARRLEKTATFMSKKGTYNYMAPEVYKGEMYGAPCDIYSLGMVMYYYLNRGRLPFLPPAPLPISPEDRENSLLRRMKGESIPAPCDADDELSKIVLKACAFDPKDRFDSAMQMRVELQKCRYVRSWSADPVEQGSNNNSKENENSESINNNDDHSGGLLLDIENKPEGEATQAVFSKPITKEEDQKRFETGSANETYREIPDIVPPSHDSLLEEPTSSSNDIVAKKHNDNRINMAIKISAVFAAVLLLALIGTVIWFANAGSGCGDSRQKSPRITRIPNEDAYWITVYAEKGTDLFFETADGVRTDAIVPNSGRIKFRVPVECLLPNEPIDNKVYEAIPKVYIKKNDGTEKLIDEMGTIIIEVPEIEVELDCSDNIVSENGNIRIAGSIDCLDSELVINGSKVNISQDGSFSCDIQLLSIGEHTINIEARASRRQIYRHVISVVVKNISTVDRLIQMPWEYGDTSYSQRVVFSTTVIELRGKVPAGSTLTAECASPKATITQPTVDSEGNFEMTVNMSVSGDFVVQLTCTDPYGHVEEREAHVQRQPNMAEYATAAHLISGTITEIIQEGDFYLAKLQRADGSIVIIEYHPHYGGAAQIEVGETYTKMCGREPKANANGELESYIWFING